MDNITHSLAGGLLAQMGLKRRSRFAFAACLLGANAPDIDVFAPLVLPVDGLGFHRGPVHGVFAWPVLAAGVVAILWLLDRFRPAPPGGIPLRPGALFVVALAAVLTHPFLDWLTTYAIAIFSPASWRWYSGDAIFIVDWVYWLLMIVGIVWSASRWRSGKPNPGRPARIAGLLMLGYIAFNLGESSRLESATADVLRQRGLQPTLVVASPPPLAFWRRTMIWRTADRFGSGHFDPVQGLRVDLTSQPLNLNDPRLAAAEARDAHVRAFLSWSRMPLVIEHGGRAFLTDQRFYSTFRATDVPTIIRDRVRARAFVVPLDKRRGNS